MAAADGNYIYQTPVHEVHDVDPVKWQPHGVILNKVITDDNNEYNFFGKSHRISDSGFAWLYDVYDEKSNNNVSSIYIQDDDNSTVFDHYGWLCSHMILDYAPEDVGFRDIAGHIHNQDPVTYYQESVENVLDFLDEGGTITFAVLLNMYYYGSYDFNNYKSHRIYNTQTLWDDAISWCREDFGDQRGEIAGALDYWPDYAQARDIYHPSYSMDQPGMVFECFKSCSGDHGYTIRSLNHVDEYHVYDNVSRDMLGYILKGNHYGLQLIADAANVTDFPACTHDWFLSGFNNYFDKYTRHEDRYQWPLIEYSPQSSVYAADFNLIKNECTNNGVWTDPDTGTTYDTNGLYPLDPDLLDDNGDVINIPIDTPLNYPVFVTFDRQPSNPPVPGNTGFEQGLINGYGTLFITKNWDDDNCRAFRPDEIFVDLYWRLYGSNDDPIYYTTVCMNQGHRVSETQWSAQINIPNRYNGQEISWFAQERPISVPNSQYVSSPTDVYEISYENSTLINNVIYGTPGSSFVVNITNTLTSELYKMLETENIPITINKVWAREDCSNCHISVNISVNDVDYQIHPHEYVSILVSWDNINPNLANNIRELDSFPGWHSLIMHSDNCLEWTIMNIPDDWGDIQPCDPSGFGDIFYFEVDPECLSTSPNTEVVGIQVSGNWGPFRGVSEDSIFTSNYTKITNDSNDIYGAWDGNLCYKIVEYENGFNHYDPSENPEEYIHFMTEGWKPYWGLSGSEQIYDLHNQGYSTYSLTNDTISGGVNVLFDRSQLMASGKKIRIYIAACAIPTGHDHNLRLSTQGHGFQVASLVVNKDNEIYYEPDWRNHSPAKVPNEGVTSIPIRCGGYIGALYNLSDAKITPMSGYNYDYCRSHLSKTGNYYSDGSWWWAAKVPLYDPISHYNDSDADGGGGAQTWPFELKDIMYNGYDTTGNHTVKEYIHDINNPFFKVPDIAFRNQYVLLDDSEVGSSHWNNNGIVSLGLIPNQDSWLLCSAYLYGFNVLANVLALIDSNVTYNLMYGPGDYDTDNYKGTWGDLFDRTFYNMQNLVDASQLTLLAPVLDMQYHRTFMNTGLGNYTGYSTTDNISSKNNLAPCPYLPVWLKGVVESVRPFAIFKDMYRGCKYLNNTSITNYTLMLPSSAIDITDNIGMHCFDSMFKNSGISDLSNIDLPLYTRVPYGVCRGMFEGCTQIATSGDAILSNVLKNTGTMINQSAFRRMFYGARTIPYQPIGGGKSLTIKTLGLSEMYRYASQSQADSYTLCQINGTYSQGACAGMFSGSSNYKKVQINTPSGDNKNKFMSWAFADMFSFSGTTYIDTHYITRWAPTGTVGAFNNWGFKINGWYSNSPRTPHNWVFKKHKKLNKTFNRHRIPKKKNKWIVDNYS